VLFLSDAPILRLPFRRTLGTSVFHALAAHLFRGGVMPLHLLENLINGRSGG
jgi:hypothetical protein